MKKLIIFFMLFVLLLTGCGRKQNEYDSKGRLSKEYVYSDSGEYQGYNIYEHEDTHDYVKYFASYDSSDKLTFTLEDEFDDMGNKTHSLSKLYDEDGSVKDTFEGCWEYDENGNLIKTITYDSDGNMTEEIN